MDQGDAPVTGHGYSLHGHPCCYLGPAERQPGMVVAGCGGAPICGKCTADRDLRHGARTCAAAGEDLHTITCLHTAATQPHAMVDDDGDMYYPDSPEDAAFFAEQHGARPLNPVAFANAFIISAEVDRHGH